MKKFKALIFALLFVLSLGLISCDKNKTQDPTDESTIPTDGITEDVSSEPENNDVLDGDFIEDNIPEKEEVEEVNTLVQKYYATTGFDSESIVSRSYESNGLLVVQNDEGHIGFYSLYYNKYLIKPMYVSEWLRYSVNPSGVTLNGHMYYVLKATYAGVQTYYDSLGNVLYEGNELNTVAVEYTTLYDTLYCTVSVTDSLYYYTNNTYFKYKTDGKVESIYDIQSDALANKPVEEPTEEVEFPLGSQYNDYVDLSEFGLDLYVATSNNYYTVYDSNYEKLHTFYIPKEAGNPVVITNKLYYQIPYQLPEDAIEYDYSQGLNKYNVKTFSINLETGEQLEERVEYRIIESEPYNKENSNLYYSILTVQHVNEDKTMGNIASYLVDSNGVFHDNVTNKNLKSFVKVGQNYYNKVTNILYNSNLEEIAYLASAQPRLYQEEGYFICRVDGLYGIIDSNARVVAEFNYDNIITPFDDDCVIAVKDEVYYRLDLSSRSSTELGVAPRKLNDNLYVFESFGSIYFEGISKQHLSKTPGTNEVLSYSYNSLNAYGLEASSQLVKVTRTKTIETFNEQTYSYDTTYEYTYEYITFVINPLPNQDSYKELGTELTKHVNTGEYREDAIALKEGADNALHHVARNYAYYAFTPVREGYYTINLPSNLTVSVQDSKEQTVSYSTYSSGYTVYLKPEETYYFRVTDSYSTGVSYFEFEFGLEDGTNSSYPLIYNDLYKKVEVDAYQNVYIKFTAPYDAVYKLSFNNPNVLAYVDEAYNSINYANGDEMTLTAGQTVQFRLYSSNGENQTVNFAVVVSENQTEGQSLFSATPLPTVEEEADVFMPDSYGKYYSYKNTTTNIQVVTLKTSSTYNRSYKQTVYNNAKEVLYESYIGTLESVSYVVLPQQTIYYELSEFSDTYYSISAYMSVVDYVEELEILADGTNITLNGPTLFRLDSYKLTGEVLSLALTNPNYNYNRLTLFDNLGNVVFRSSNAYNINQNVIIDPTLTYFLHIDTGATTDTVYVTYSTQDLYTISSNYFNAVAGTLTPTNKTVGTTCTYSITANANVTVSFRLLTSYNSSYNSFTVYKNSYTTSVNYSSDTYRYNEITLYAGDTLVFEYNNNYAEYNPTTDDTIYIKDLTVKAR